MGYEPSFLIMEVESGFTIRLSILRGSTGEPKISSLYGWETGCIVPATLSDPLMAVQADLVTDEDGNPGFTRAWKEAASDYGALKI
jgi:hypothetical protein